MSKDNDYLAVLTGAVWIALAIVVSSFCTMYARAGCLNAPDDNGGRGFHIAVSAGIGATVAETWADGPAIGQVAIALIPGVAKETYDCASYGLFSRNDMVSNLEGAVLGVASQRLFRHWFPRSPVAVGITTTGVMVALRF